MKNILLAGLGGFFGSGLRYYLQTIIASHFKWAFPLGTFLVNAIGCFLIGLIFGLGSKNGIISNDLKLFLTVGFCGGFTTFSAFSNESLTLLKNGNFLIFAAYILLSIIVCLAFTYFGYLVFKQ